MIDLGARKHDTIVGRGRLEYAASCDQNRTIIQQSSRLTIPVRGHIAGIAERAPRGIIEFATVSSFIEVLRVVGHEPAAPAD